MPPAQTAIGILSLALARLEQRQMPQRLTPVGAGMYDALAPQLPFGQRLVLANRWLFGPLLLRLNGRSAAGAASQRTTTAATVFQGGIKDNVLPTVAVATVNFRILPGDTVDTVLRHVRDVVDDSRVEIALQPKTAVQNPSAVSSIEGLGYRSIAQTIRQLFPGATVAPYLVLGATDSAHYAPLSAEIFRFSPMLLDEADLERIHGVNERVSNEGYLRAVRFMAQLLRNTAG